MAASQAHERVLILDFGSQYTQLIARRVRECGVYSEIVPYTISPADLAAGRPVAIILSGGPASVTQAGGSTGDPGLLRLGIPVLGICYGLQWMAKMLGGRVLAVERREYGRAILQVLKRQDLFVGLGPGLQVWMSHGDQVVEVPKGFEIIARTPTAPVAAIANARKRLYGLQFHPEVVHTPRGLEILRNFLFRAAKCRGGWTAQSFVATAVEQVRRTVGDGRVLCATSGGVDSSVLAAMLHRAIGDRLECVFINNGLLRKNEAANVRRKFRDHLGIHVHCVNASRQFLKRLRNVASPERKRRIIGNVFIRVFEREARRLGSPAFLAQGTLYPDVIESRSARGGPSATIKTHHNVGGLPANLRFKLIEPFRSLFKDEVRRVGEQLGLPPRLFGPVSPPGAVVGPLLSALRTEAPTGIQAVLPAAHDTASAVAATPGQGDWAYLSLGTWALLGIELTTPILSEASMLANFTNEGGVDQTYRYLKNVTGLWLLQECRRVWSEEGRSLDYGELVAMAQTSPAFAAFIDPDHKAFQSPGNMPAAIADYCTSTGQTPPSAVGTMARTIFEGIALKCRRVMATLQKLTGRTIARLHLVGGGAQNRLLCQFFANALGIPVFAGPVEATAAGNVLIQAVALGHLGSIKDAREIVRESFEIARYEPRDREPWEEAYQKFSELIASEG